MPTPQKWSNVQVAVQSALATAVTINSMSKANPCVVGYTGTDPTNGDYAVFTVNGMRQADARVFRLANVNAAGNTVELEGVDSTLFDTFISGTFQVITFGTSMATVTDLSASGGGFGFIDTTTIHDAQKKQITDLPEAASYSLTNIWDLSDAALLALKAASDTQAKRAFRFTFQTGNKFCFTGYVGAGLWPGGSAGQLVTTEVVVTADGPMSAYAT